ncbi:MAG: hypothetical protein HY982_02240 [Candidatus Magasanikbacteria bacterium]|nr:hypothetical protein [Candidatus Magasanikbacteria bacterium]
MNLPAQKEVAMWCLLKGLVTIVFFAAMWYVLTSLAFIASGCGGGGGDGSPPVFNDQGVCVANCPVDGGGGDQPDVRPYVCPDPENPPEVCKPKVGAECLDYGDGSFRCYGGYYEYVFCTTDAECQEVPKDEWSPCECWDVCVLTAYNWKCSDGRFYEHGHRLMLENGFCLAQGPWLSYYKPGNDQLYLQFPAEGEGKPELTILISSDGLTLKKTMGSVTITCTHAG